MRKAIALAATGAVGLALALNALAGSPLDDQYGTQAQALLASAPVTYRGTNWGPVPIYEIDLRPTVNETVDIAAADEASARADSTVVSIVERGLWDAAGDPPLTTSTTTTTQTTAVVTAPSTTTTTPAFSAQSQSAVATTTIAAPAVTTTTTAVAPATPSASVTSEIAEASFPTTTTYITRQLAVSTSVPLAVSLGKTLGLQVTFASTVKFAIKGKKVTASQIRSALKKSRSVRLTLTIRNHHFVVLSLTA